MAIPSQNTTMKRSLLKDKAYSAIKNRIQNATFAPGSFLSERQLATLLGMSKTPVKAALERLELEGLVLVSPQQGIAVCELSIKEVADQFELRKALESFVVSAIAGQLNEKQLARVDRNLLRQSAAASKGDVERLVELDAEFHLLLCELFGNAAIRDCLLQHRSKMHRVIRQVMSNGSGRLADAVKEHKGIFAAIKSGKSARAVTLIEKHLEYGKQYLLSSGWT
jgi:DNA-binding GntR family transcriptional regulator